MHVHDRGAALEQIQYALHVCVRIGAHDRLGDHLLQRHRVSRTLLASSGAIGR
jgi:hypothetical protein